MSKVYILLEGQEDCVNYDTVIGIVTNPKVAELWKNLKWVEFSTDKHFVQEVELDDPEILNRIAKESQPYKGAITIPCSVCSEDPKMELHDHSHVAIENRIAKEGEKKS